MNELRRSLKEAEFEKKFGNFEDGNGKYWITSFGELLVRVRENRSYVSNQSRFKC